MNIKISKIATAIGLSIILNTASPALARDVKCRISKYGTVTFKGVCDYEQWKGDDGSYAGSFTLSGSSRSRTNEGFLEAMDAHHVSVTILSPGKGDVRELTVGGINSRWGYVRRSNTDEACWVSADENFVIDHSFEICAW